MGGCATDFLFADGGEYDWEASHPYAAPVCVAVTSARVGSKLPAQVND